MSRYTAPPILIPKRSIISENVTAPSEEEKNSCEGLVNEEECTNALKDFDNNKSPGTDGLPAKFYRFFWPDICHDLLASYNFASQCGMLSISQRRGIISLIPKTSKDKTLSFDRFSPPFSLAGSPPRGLQITACK